MKRPKGNRGMALLVVLVVVALLTTLVTEIAFTTMVDMRLTETFRDTTRAYYLAKGGINAGRMILKEDRNSYDSLNEDWSRDVSNYPVGDGFVSVHITDMDGKLGLNALVSDNSPNSIMVDRFFRLLLALDIVELADPAELTAALIDWLDSGDEPYTLIQTDGAQVPTGGAESSYYQGLKNPYPAQNRPLETLDELQRVKGFTPDVLQRLAPHVSVHGTAAVNLNTASPQVLMCLSRDIDFSVAAIIEKRRNEIPLVRIDELESLLPDGPYSALKSMENLKQVVAYSRYFRIEADATVNEGRRRLMAELDRKNNQMIFFKVY